MTLRKLANTGYIVRHCSGVSSWSLLTLPVLAPLYADIEVEMERYAFLKHRFHIDAPLHVYASSQRLTSQLAMEFEWGCRYFRIHSYHRLWSGLENRCHNASKATNPLGDSVLSYSKTKSDKITRSE